MSIDIWGPLVVGLIPVLYILYGIRAKRQGKDTMKHTVPLLIALGLSATWLLLIIMPVVIVATLLIAHFAPAALWVSPSWLMPAIILAAVLVTIVLTYRSVRRGLG